MTKTAEALTLCDCTNLYSPYKGVALPPGGTLVHCKVTPSINTLVPSYITCDHTLPPLYSDVVKEGMIHLLVGSYVKKPDSGFFSDWSRNNAYETLHSYWLSYLNLISSQSWSGMARRKQNGGDRARF